MRIGLIACSSLKKEGQAIPEIIYSKSSLNKYCVQYCKKYLDDYYFLSAKYGFLHKTQIIKNYNLTLNNFNIQDKIIWSNNVYSSLISTIPKETELYILAGKNYYIYFLEKIKQDYKITCLFENYSGIGYILSFLKTEVNKIDKNKLF